MSRGSFDEGVDTVSILGWSLPLFRLGRAEWRASWLLGVWMLFDLVTFMHREQELLAPLALVIPPLAIGLHALAHQGMAALVGGSTSRITLSILNEQASYQLPQRALAHGATAAAGILASLIIWLTSSLVATKLDPGTWAAEALTYVAFTNSQLVIWNLLACSLFDGARLWRALLWPVFGMRKACVGGCYLSHVSALVLICFGVYFTNYLLLFMGVISLIISFQEHRSVRSGWDPVLDAELELAVASSWWSRRQAYKSERLRARRLREQGKEQEVLDRLLDKVSRDGLPSLSERERSLLQNISKRQRERSEGR